MATRKMVLVLAGYSLAALATAIRVGSGSADKITAANGEFVPPARPRFVRLGDALCHVVGIATMRGRNIGGTYLRMQVIQGETMIGGERFARDDQFTLDGSGSIDVNAEELSEGDGIAEILSGLGMSEPDLSGDNLPTRKEKTPVAASSAPRGRVGIVRVSQGAPSRFAGAAATNLGDSPALAALDAMTDVSATEG